MLQDFVKKSTRKVLGALEITVSELVSLKQNVLTPDFILLALVSQQDSEAVKIIEHVLPEPVDAIAQIKGTGSSSIATIAAGKSYSDCRLPGAV